MKIKVLVEENVGYGGKTQISTLYEGEDPKKAFAVTALYNMHIVSPHKAYIDIISCSESEHKSIYKTAHKGE